MLHLVVDPLAPDADVVSRAAGLVTSGGVLAYPTDTLYGLAVDPCSAQAVERLFAIKGRAADQAIPLVAADVEQVEREVGHLTDLGRRLAARFWPGPLTLIVEASPRISRAIHHGTGHVAVRVPSHAVACALARACGRPITSTSANLSGDPAPDAAERIAPALAARLDAVLDAGRTAGGLPSTIVDVLGAVPVLVREGVVPFPRVLECR